MSNGIIYKDQFKKESGNWNDHLPDATIDFSTKDKIFKKTAESWLSYSEFNLPVIGQAGMKFFLELKTTAFETQTSTDITIGLRKDQNFSDIMKYTGFFLGQLNGDATYTGSGRPIDWSSAVLDAANHQIFLDPADCKKDDLHLAEIRILKSGKLQLAWDDKDAGVAGDNLGTFIDVPVYFTFAPYYPLFSTVLSDFEIRG